VLLIRPARSFDEAFERDIALGALQARDRKFDPERRLEPPVLDPRQRQAQTGRDEAEAKLRVADLRYLLPGAGGSQLRHHHRKVDQAAQCRRADGASHRRAALS